MYQSMFKYILYVDTMFENSYCICPMGYFYGFISTDLKSPCINIHSWATKNVVVTVIIIFFV